MIHALRMTIGFKVEGFFADIYESIHPEENQTVDERGEKTQLATNSHKSKLTFIAKCHQPYYGFLTTIARSRRNEGVEEVEGGEGVEGIEGGEGVEDDEGGEEELPQKPVYSKTEPMRNPSTMIRLVSLIPRLQTAVPLPQHNDDTLLSRLNCIFNERLTINFGNEGTTRFECELYLKRECRIY
ncbi:hypothetical protein Tcan_09025 [Toxocara canis]|uniref:Uncharacterized protein n=1 Tax=Toxocara canis TaxID=6265 RepID=A0A0B2VCB1_TOXCA|nr:hypothetical protein Tcan_09025 [Toxocara canis]